MKKVLMIIMIAMTTFIASKAEEGYGTCKISGTNDYVEGTAYLTLSDSGRGIVNGKVSGHLVISNSSARPLQAASIKVSVTYTGTITKQVKNKYGREENRDYLFEKSAIVYDTRWTGSIAGYQSAEVPLNKDLELPGNAYVGNAYVESIKEISVSINNPYCINKGTNKK